MEQIGQVVQAIQAKIWGIPLLTVLIGVGIYLTVILRGMQFRYLWYVCRTAFKKDRNSLKGDLSPIESVMTSMASAVGTGSIVGVATAICAGGLGAIFWMWVTSALCMSIKYAESLLAVRYRETDPHGEMVGGPMYYIEKGLGWKWLASSFAIFASVAAIGTGNLVQVNSIAEAINTIYTIDPLWTGLFLAVLTGVVLLGGVKSIGRVASLMVPIMAAFYILGGLIVICLYSSHVPDAFYLIFSSAFSGQAALGGCLGSTVMMAVQMGVMRSVFSSEAGLGISSIAAAAARTTSSSKQALMSMAATIISTMVICTITAMVIAVTGVLGQVNEGGKLLNGAALAIAAFNVGVNGGHYVVVIGLILFAYSTVIAWAYYGEKCIEYLFGVKAINIYRAVFTLLVIPGAIFELDIVWSFADIMNALMMIPNMMALVGLAKVVQQETKEFIENIHNKSDPGSNSNSSLSEPSYSSL